MYADILSPAFKEHHKILKEFANAGKISYRVRHRPSPTRKNRPVMLSGYGVELALKKTDYIVMDDRDMDSSAEERQSDSKHPHSTTRRSSTSHSSTPRAYRTSASMLHRSS